ncbi:MAG: Ig-like domain-containing protein, partial [Gemmatimonadetes bacterium]|nr:Ig-like domain-containing protein [Gemmatimonadota bacterium]
MPTPNDPTASHSTRTHRAARTALVVAIAAALAGCHEKSSNTAPKVAPVASITVTPTTAVVEVHGTQQLTDVEKDSAGTVLTGRTVTWTTSDSTKATVSASGLVTAIATGSASITATSEGKTASADINIPVQVGSVKVSPDTAFMLVGGAVQLSATVRDTAGNVTTARTVSWQSSSTTIASVSTTGLVTGIALGTTSVSAIAGTKNGIGVISVVSSPPPSTPGVTVTPATATVTAGSTLQLMATDALGNRLASGVAVWTSSNGAVATVSGDGVVSALKAGTASITATRGTSSGTAVITVTPPPPPVTFASVSAGDRYSCGVSTGGAVYCWGANDADQLGTGTGADTFTPQQIAVGGA